MSDMKMLELFSKNLRRMMKEENMRQEDLAKEIGVSRQMVSKYINGQCIPSYFTIVRISDALFCSLEEFVQE